MGTETNITMGFIEEWLAWHDQRKEEREATFRTSQIYWTRWAALAASGAVIVAVIGWVITLWSKA